MMGPSEQNHADFTPPPHALSAEQDNTLQNLDEEANDHLFKENIALIAEMWIDKQPELRGFILRLKDALERHLDTIGTRSIDDAFWISPERASLTQDQQGEALMHISLMRLAAKELNITLRPAGKRSADHLDTPGKQAEPSNIITGML